LLVVACAAEDATNRGLSGPAETRGGAAVYPRGEGASFWSAADGGYEEWLLLRHPAAGPAAEWEVTGASLEETEAGIALFGADGEARILVTAPDVLFLARLDNQALSTARVTQLSASGASFALPGSLKKGWYLAWVVVNGVTSDAEALLIQ
jgi:hypothetical protein